MSDNGLKLAYVASLLRVKLDVTRGAVMANENPPIMLLEKAKAKMEAEKKAGRVRFYKLQTQLLTEAWQKLREMDKVEDSYTISVILAQGVPPMAGLKLEPGDDEKTLCYLTITAPHRTVMTWRGEWLHMLICQWMKTKGIKGQPNSAQVAACLVRAQKEEAVTDVPIVPLPDSVFSEVGRPYAILANKQRMEVAVVIKRSDAFADSDFKERLLNLVTQAVKQLAGSSGQFQYFLRKKDFHSAMEQADTGVEALGLELPLVVLAAVGFDRLKSNSSLQGRLEFGVSDDRMEVVVKTFDKTLYKDPNVKVSIDTINAELARLQIKAVVPIDMIPILNEAISRSEDLSGLLVARGTIGLPGQDPYLYPVFRDASSRMQVDFDSDAVDMRELQQRATVKKGQLVAKVAYKRPAKPTIDVFGGETIPEPKEKFTVKVGTGIEQRGDKYFAAQDGVPVIDDNSVSLSSQMVHEGDVNLRSGNIRFDGPVEIKGSIDSGATVEASGDIIVHGTIRGGFVKARGDLICKAGINMGMKGRVQAKGDIKAEFIENSRVICGGNLKVRRVCINSEVVVAGNINVGNGGLLAGGTVICRGNIRTENLGFPKGAITKCNVGVDWRAEYAVSIREARMEKVNEKQQKDRAELREIVSKKTNQMTKRHQELKVHLQNQLTKARVVLEKMAVHLANARAQLTYEEDSKIYCRGTITSNSDIRVGGHRVRVTHDVAGVALLPTRKRGSYIHPIDEVLAKEAEEAAATNNDVGLAS